MKQTLLLVLLCLGGRHVGFAEEFRLSMKAAGSRTIRYFAAGAPSTWLYFDDKRVDRFGKFKTPNDIGSRYNNWHLGFARPARYAASVSQSAAMRNLSQRHLLCFCGTEDVLEEYLSTKPGAMLQGKNRHERFKNYQKHIQRFPKLANAVRFVEVPGAGHEGVGLVA